MRPLRCSLAGLLAISSALFLAECGSGGSPQAAGAGESGGIWEKITHAASHKVTIPEGTPIRVRLVDPVGSARDSNGDRFEATLDEPIVAQGSVVVPKGAPVMGKVLEARPSGHLKTPAELAITLTAVEVGGETYELSTSERSWRGPSHKKRDAEWIGGLAGAGALIGGLVGHGKGVAIGAGAGAGAGTATAYATGKRDILLRPETPLDFVLRHPVTITKAG